nr:aromatic amino acid lyase [Sutterella massiliensis]
MASAVCWRNSKGALTETARKASEEFNRNILRSHSVGFGPYLDKEIVRLSMVIRLNTRCSRGARACSPTWPSSVRRSSIRASPQ